MNLDHITHPLVYYHGPGCLDGFASAWLAAKRWPDAELLPVNYGDLPDWKRVAGRHVLVLDFSWSRENMLKLREVTASLLTLDHHASAQAELTGLDFCVFDMQRSGAGLTLDYLFPGMRGFPGLHFVMVARIVEDRDLWRFDLPTTKEICAYLATVPQTLEAWSCLPCTDDMRSAGAAMLRAQDALVARIAAHAYEVTWPEGKVTVCNSSVLQSEAGNFLAKPGVPACVWYRDTKGTIRCSLRSIDVDVSVWANFRGGGGHRLAAGFEVHAGGAALGDWIVKGRGYCV